VLATGAAARLMRMLRPREPAPGQPTRPGERDSPASVAMIPGSRRGKRKTQY